MNIWTVCNVCRTARQGRHAAKKCPACGAPAGKQSEARESDLFPMAETKPGNAFETWPDKRLRLLTEFNEVDNLAARERSKAFADQATLNYYERKLASIEAEFQKRGEDIGLYL